jgi:hypothetical protein
MEEKVGGASALGVNGACNMAKSTLRRINSKHHAGAHGLPPNTPTTPHFWLQLFVASSFKWPLNSGSTQRRELVVGLSCCCLFIITGALFLLRKNFLLREIKLELCLVCFVATLETEDSNLYNLKN